MIGGPFLGMPTRYADRVCRQGMPTGYADRLCQHAVPTGCHRDPIRDNEEIQPLVQMIQKWPPEGMPTTYADNLCRHLCRQPMPTTYADNLCRHPMPTTYADKLGNRKGCQANINRHAAIYIYIYILEDRCRPSGGPGAVLPWMIQSARITIPKRAPRWDFMDCRGLQSNPHLIVSMFQPHI
jgi:hypothetical protein